MINNAPVNMPKSSPHSIYIFMALPTNCGCESRWNDSMPPRVQKTGPSHRWLCLGAFSLDLSGSASHKPGISSDI